MTLTGEEVPAIPDVLIENAELRDILQALKQVTEIREGRRGDVNQRHITYYELIDYLAGNDQITVEAVTGGHNHDTLYSPLSHDHDSVYSLLSHNHDTVYLKITDAEGQYALILHDHDDLYSVVGHGHTKYEGVFALIQHHHDGLYEPIGPRPWKKLTANGVTLGGGPPTSSDAVADLQDGNDGNTYTATEIAGNAGQYLIVDFADVISFSLVEILIRINESPGHSLTVQLEVSPFDGSTWHSYDLITDQAADQNFENHSFPVPDCSPYINSGVVKIKFNHEASGTAADTWVFDLVALHRQ